MRADTQAVTIGSPAKEVHAFVADPANLPRWAIGFAEDVEPDGRGGWTVATSSGPVRLRVEADDTVGTVDFVMEPAPGVEAVAYSRVIPNGDGCEYVFTQFQTPGMPDEVFEGQVEAIPHEFATLKAHMEVVCPA